MGGEKWVKDKDGMNQADYYVESQDYPQQTALLGLIRYYLLLQNPQVFNGKKITDRDKAAELIGDSGFSFQTDRAAVASGYGLIRSLSPLYFTHQDDPYWFAPLDVQLELDEKMHMSSFQDGERKDFNCKDHQGLIQTHLFSCNRIVSADEVFRSVEQVGNEKVSDGRDRTGKFYRQTFKRLAPKWSFAIDVTFDKQSEWVVDSGQPVFLPFGGEKSIFRLEVKELTHEYEPELKDYTRSVPYLRCLSDCFIDFSEIGQTAFSVTDFVSFRNILSKVKETSRYSSLARQPATAQSDNTGDQLAPE